MIKVDNKTTTFKGSGEEILAELASLIKAIKEYMMSKGCEEDEVNEVLTNVTESALYADDWIESARRHIAEDVMNCSVNKLARIISILEEDEE